MDENIIKRTEIKKENERRSEIYSKRRFMSNLEKKFNTCMIGCIASFEDHFGELWGHGKPLENLTQEELEWRSLWDKTRHECLNKGNGCKRGALDEASQYTMKWDSYHVDFIIKKKEDE